MTGTGKSRITAATLAKVPSEKRSTHEASAAKSASKHSGPDKAANDAGDPLATNEWINTEMKNASKHSGSKKATSNQENAWGGENWEMVAAKEEVNGSADAWPSGGFENTWDPTVSMDDKDKKKDDTTGNPPTTNPVVEAVLPAVTVAPVVEEKKPNDSKSWTKEQDEKLIQMKTDNGIWPDIAKELRKSLEECKKHFGEIKPKDWRPNPKGWAGGGGKNKKKGKNKDDNKADENEPKVSCETVGGDGGIFGGMDAVFEDNANKGDCNKKDDAGKKQTDVYASGGASSWGNSGGGAAWADVGGNTAGWDDTGGGTGGPETSGGNAWEKGDCWGVNEPTGAGEGNADIADVWNTTFGGNVTTGGAWIDVSGGNATAAAWDDINQNNNAGGSGGIITATGWDTDNNQNNTGGGAAGQGTVPPKPPSASRSDKAPSQSRSQFKDNNNNAPEPTQSAPARPVGIELRPDETFSANDLRLIARILQQDCSMVWNRLSWRFKDKTGRTLHPDMFEKKVTGQVEGKSSDKGGRRK